MWVVSFGFGSILALFYHPNCLQWTEIHEVTKLFFFCGSIIVTGAKRTGAMVFGCRAKDFRRNGWHAQRKQEYSNLTFWQKIS